MKVVSQKNGESVKELIDTSMPPESETDHDRYRRELNDKRFDYLSTELSNMSAELFLIKELIHETIKKQIKFEENHLQHMAAEIKELKDTLISLLNPSGKTVTKQ